MIQLNSSSSHTLVDLSKITDHSDMTLYVNSRMELVQFSYKDVTYDIDEYEMKEDCYIIYCDGDRLYKIPVNLHLIPVNLSLTKMPFDTINMQLIMDDSGNDIAIDSDEILS